MDKELILRCWQDWTEVNEGLRYSIFNLDDKADRIVLINEWDEMIAFDRFTGQFDKNKKPIFENDIVRGKRPANHPDKDEYYIGVVSWDNEEIVGYRCKFTIDGVEYKYYFCGWYEYEILGNVLLNPELLEGK